MAKLLCLECGEPMASRGYSSTLVGYGGNPCKAGFFHDDNCHKHDMVCTNGHHRMVAQRQTCPCGWKGKLTCGCHEGDKLEFEP